MQGIALKSDISQSIDNKANTQSAIESQSLGAQSKTTGNQITTDKFSDYERPEDIMNVPKDLTLPIPISSTKESFVDYAKQAGLDPVDKRYCDYQELFRYEQAKMRVAESTSNNVLQSDKLSQDTTKQTEEQGKLQEQVKTTQDQASQLAKLQETTITSIPLSKPDSSIMPVGPTILSKSIQLVEPGKPYIQGYRLTDNTPTDDPNYKSVFNKIDVPTSKMVEGHILNDFSSDKDFQVSLYSYVQGVEDVGKRAAIVAVSQVVGSAAGNAVKAAQLGGPAAFLADNGISYAVDKYAQEKNVRVLDSDRMVFKNIYDNIKAIPGSAITSFSYQYSVITTQEAKSRNQVDTVASTTVGSIKGVGAITGMIRTQPFEAGQVEYKVRVYYSIDNPCSTDWRIDLNYRMDDYKTMSGETSHEVISANYVNSYYDLNQYAYVPSYKGVEHAPQ